MENKQPIIQILNLSKTYKTGKTSVCAIGAVDLTINEGEFVAITGESGSGKSTLLHIIGCIDRPTSGQVYIEGRDVTRLSDSRLSDLRKTTLGFVFQSFYLQPFLRLDDNVAVPAMFTSKKYKDIQKAASTLLDSVGLGERKKHYPDELSGGEVQRAAIARALINNPKILLADEPTGNLDTENSEVIISLFRHIREYIGTTVVIVTHNPDIARQADRVITMKDGAVV